MANPLATLVAKAMTRTGVAVLGALTTGIAFGIAYQNCHPSLTPSASRTSVTPAASSASLIATNAPQTYTNVFPVQQPQLAVGAKKTSLENIASIKREGETFVVGTNIYAVPSQLNWVLYQTSNLTVKANESDSYLYSAPFVGVPTLVTNKDGTPWHKAMPLPTNGPAGITARLEFLQQSYGDNGVGMKAHIRQSRPLLSWKLEGTNYHLPTGSDGTNIYAIRAGNHEYHANGAVALNDYTWRIHWIPERQWLSQHAATNIVTTNAPALLGIAGTVSVPANP